MKYKILFFLSFFIGCLPTSFLRVFFYKVIFRYDLNNVRVGFGCRIYCRSFSAANCNFGSFNSFIGPFTIIFRDNCTVGRGNHFFCDDFALTSEKFYYKREAIFGENCNISHNHYFDISGRLTVGNNCWFGGIGTQVWTHGPGLKERVVSIGNNCYIGSSSLIGPGAKINDYTLVAMGSCLTKAFNRHYQLIGGVPAKLIYPDFNWTTWEHL